MKRFKQFIMLLSVALIFGSCSGIKVVDSWKADEIESLSGAKILVIARSDDMVGRQRFEQEIAERLRAGGIDATESYKKFPSMKQNQQLTEEQIGQRVQIIKNEGYKGVVLTVLKDMSKEIVTSETGGYVSGGYYPSYYGGYYGGFGRTYTSETYNLETVIYNLDLEPGKQLLGVIAIDITDPKSTSKVAPAYADAVLKQLKK